MSPSLTRQAVERNLAALGLRLPDLAPSSRGSYTVVRVDSDLAHTSALGPFELDGSGRFTHVGEVGTDLDEEPARAAAAVTALNLIAAVDQHPGMERVLRIIELIAYVRARSEFESHAAVADGASEVLLTAFGPEMGAHARTVIGVRSLPFGVPVVASMKVRLQGEVR
ncbi:MAG TPA: RidA family protein [Acidimicrobiia bacterium]|nr:RidA family protein [Acidimicrobiia bacterium]